jgi:hypothetical protein
MARIGALAGLLLAIGALGGTSAHAADLRVKASFDRHARLGRSTVLNLGLHVDRIRQASPVTAARLFYPRGLGVVSSGLGLAACERPASEFEAVLISGSGLGGCPPNAVMAYGTVRAEVRLNQTGQVIPEYATLTVLSGPLDHGRLQLVIFIDGQRPFGGRFILSGEAVGASAPYGGALIVRFPQVASLQDIATIALTDLQLSVGSKRIIYFENGVPFHPEGTALPERCPSAAFQFAVDLEFQSGQHRGARTTVPCP